MGLPHNLTALVAQEAPRGGDAILADEEAVACSAGYNSA